MSSTTSIYNDESVRAVASTISAIMPFVVGKKTGLERLKVARDVTSAVLCSKSSDLNKKSAGDSIVILETARQLLKQSGSGTYK
ncbi:MAG: hypothetical protein DLM72_11515 [Candidatus Nitrosopolaris wilkensis]|nr:MAG: hypothetical protein DLM72_11515 [Candidatus Nitrosopolaris wilkensis]